MDNVDLANELATLKTKFTKMKFEYNLMSELCNKEQFENIHRGGSGHSHLKLLELGYDRCRGCNRYSDQTILGEGWEHSGFKFCCTDCFQFFVSRLEVDRESTFRYQYKIVKEACEDYDKAQEETLRVLKELRSRGVESNFEYAIAMEGEREAYDKHINAKRKIDRLNRENEDEIKTLPGASKWSEYR